MPVNNDLSIFCTNSLIIFFRSSRACLSVTLLLQTLRKVFYGSFWIDGMISPATWNGCPSMHFPAFITRLLDFGGFSCILTHFRATTVLCKAILEAGVEAVIKLTSSMNARSTGIDFLVDREYYGNPAWLTYSKVTLNAARNMTTVMVHPANIPFLPQSPLQYLITTVIQSSGILYLLNAKRINTWETDPYGLAKSNQTIDNDLPLLGASFRAAQTIEVCSQQPASFWIEPFWNVVSIKMFLVTRGW